MEGRATQGVFTQEPHTHILHSPLCHLPFTLPGADGQINQDKRFLFTLAVLARTNESFQSQTLLWSKESPIKELLVRSVCGFSLPLLFLSSPLSRLPTL